MTPAVPRTSCAGVTPRRVRTVASAGRPTRCTAASATAAGPASTATCPTCPARWPRSDKVAPPPRPGLPAPAGCPPSGVRTSETLLPVRPPRHQRHPSVPERGALSGCGQHAPLPLPSGLHRQLLRGPGGRVLTQPLPERGHLHRLPWRLLLRGGDPSWGAGGVCCERHCVPGPRVQAGAAGRTKSADAVPVREGSDNQGRLPGGGVPRSGAPGRGRIHRNTAWGFPLGPRPQSSVCGLSGCLPWASTSCPQDKLSPTLWAA